MKSSTSIKVSVFIATSLDGFIARTDGDIEWLHEVEPIGGDDDAGYGAFFNSIDVLVMGRGSFEKVLEFDEWPYQSKPVIVLSRSLTGVPDKLCDKVKIDASSPQDLVEKLSREGCKRIYLDGGKVIQSFISEGLVDDIIVTTIPILIGQGRPLFGPLHKDINLRLIETKSWENGLVQLHYQLLL